MRRMSSQTYAELRRQAVAVLKSLGNEQPHIDVRSLLSHASGLSRSHLIANAKDKVPPLVAEKFKACLARRKTHEPIAYIVGEKDFWTLTFKLNRHVLIPRPETEGVIEQALKLLDKQANARILDVGTGSGAILISLLHELPRAKGHGIDISKPALETAKHNAKRLGAADRCRFSVSDYLGSIQDRYDLIVATPPYITDAAMTALPKTVDKYEPHLALSGGIDGLSAYRAIISRLPNVLKSGGHVVFEIGYDQKKPVSNLLENAGATNIVCLQDLAGHARIISAKFF